VIQKVLIIIIRGYQVTFRPLLGGHCRFHPTCSDYGIEALKRHGAWSGTKMTVLRIFRCRPYGGKGYDPVPPNEKS
tara:strand:- start:76 stop:303 length:228 start_codon:yes stop_codon:yes gene_type:complete